MSLPKDVLVTQMEPQINGLGNIMGVKLIVKANTGKTITTTANTTIELSWTDTNGAQTVAKVLSAGTIDDTTGLSLGVYYPDGIIFADLAAIDTFIGSITAKIFGATIA